MQHHSTSIADFDLTVSDKAVPTDLSNDVHTKWLCLLWQQKHVVKLGPITTYKAQMQSEQTFADPELYQKDSVLSQSTSAMRESWDRQ